MPCALTSRNPRSAAAPCSIGLLLPIVRVIEQLTQALIKWEAFQGNAEGRDFPLGFGDSASRKGRKQEIIAYHFTNRRLQRLHQLRSLRILKLEQQRCRSLSFFSPLPLILIQTLGRDTLSNKLSELPSHCTGSAVKIRMPPSTRRSRPLYSLDRVLSQISESIENFGK